MAQQGSGYQARYKRILLKLSGEALMGSEEFGIDPKVLDRMALEVGQLVGIGVQVGLVIGGGNLFRGAALSAAGMDRVTGDHMGMLATVMNALAMRDALERANISAIVMSAISMVGTIRWRPARSRTTTAACRPASCRASWTRRYSCRLTTSPLCRPRSAAATTSPP